MSLPRTLDLFSNMPLLFDGATYDHPRDYPRLKTQIERVHEAISDGAWWTLSALATITNASEPAVSARLRDLRKHKFGGHVIERRYVQGGLFEYRLRPPCEGR